MRIHVLPIKMITNLKVLNLINSELREGIKLTIYAVHVSV